MSRRQRRPVPGLSQTRGHRRPWRLRLAEVTSDSEEWTRRQVRWAVLLLVLAVALIAAGVVLLFITNGPHSTPPRATSPEPLDARVGPADEIAEARMPSASLDQARPGPLATTSTPTLHLPGATQVGPAGIPSGFPQTALGALAQLAVIDAAALGGASVPRAQDVVSAWTTPGGPTAQTWSGVQAVADLLSAAGLPAQGNDQLDLQATPAMGMVKGQLPDPSQPDTQTPTPSPIEGQPVEPVAFVVPCIDMVLSATWGQQTHQIAVADCQRMVWQDGRWVLGPGAEPAAAPSLWPGTSASYDVGYRWLSTEPS